MASLMAVLGLDWSAFRSNADKAKAHARDVGSQISDSWGSFLSEKLVGFAAPVAMAEGIRRMVELEEQIFNLSRRLGVSTDAEQKWALGLKLSGVEMDKGAKFFEALEKTGRQALEGNEKITASYKRLGVSLADGDRVEFAR